jgi:hypothetical protein
MIGCSHQEKGPEDHAHALLSRMTVPEKYKILRSYRFLQNLSANPGRMPLAMGYLPGIPRLGIPSVEFVGSDRSNRSLAREEKTLKLGFVNLIRDNEKTQVFGNFNEADAVDSILGPEKNKELKLAAGRGELKDLDLFLVQEGSQERVRNYVCAQRREEDDFNCVAARMDSIIQQLGLSEDYDQLLATESIPPEDLDRLVGEVLSTMDELRLI